MISRGKPLSKPSGPAIRKGRRDEAGGASVDCPLCGPSVARELVAKEFPYQRRLCACEGCGIVRMIAENPFGRDYWEDDALGLDVYDNHEVRAEMPHFKLDANFKLMSDDERQEAALLLREMLARLSIDSVAVLSPVPLQAEA